MAVDNLWASRRQMKLLLAGIDPHIIQSNVKVRITRESQPYDIKQRGQRLVGYLDVNVLEQAVSEVKVKVEVELNLLT
jgi:hypothetical protein